MNQAADKVAQAVRYRVTKVGDEFHLTTPSSKRTVLASVAEIKLWNHAVSLQYQLSASEERVRKLENGLRDLLQAYISDMEISTNETMEWAGTEIVKRAEALLPSPPQVAQEKP